MRGSIEQRSPGSWRLRFELPRDADGRRRQGSRTVRGNKRAAQAELTRILHELHGGAYAEPSDVPLRDYLDRWLRDYAEPKLAAKTLAAYRMQVRCYIAPRLGHVPIAQLSPSHIQPVYTALLTAGGLRGGPLSARSVLHTHRVLSLALRWAVRWQLIPRNPCEAVEPPRPRQAERTALDAPTTIRILKSLRGHWTYVPVLLAVTTGMRRGEVLGLRWVDIDLKARVAAVRQTIGEVGGKTIVGAPKTPRSRRGVMLPEVAAEALMEERLRQEQARAAAGEIWDERGLVICREDGAPWLPTSVTRAFKRHLARHGLPDVCIHELRHSHASQLLAAGVPLAVVSERLGHASHSVTMSVYSHLLPGMQESACAVMDELFPGAWNRGGETRP